MTQMPFADAEYANKHKNTHKELPLIEIDQVVLWKGFATELSLERRWSPEAPVNRDATHISVAEPVQISVSPIFEHGVLTTSRRPVIGTDLAKGRFLRGSGRRW